MKRLFKRVGARVVLAILNAYKPKIDEFESEILKEALLIFLDWLERILGKLTDADPDDKEQVEAVAKEILQESPDRFLGWSLIAIENHKKLSFEQKTFMKDIITGIREELQEIEAE